MLIKQVEGEFCRELMRQSQLFGLSWLANIAYIFKLNDHAWPPLLRRGHEFCNKLLLFFRSDAVLLQAKIQRVFELVCVVGADINHNRESVGRVDACTCRVQGKLAHRDADSVYTKIAETKDARTVGHNTDRHVVRQLSENFCDPSFLLI